MQDFTFSIEAMAFCSPYTGCVPNLAAAQGACWDESTEIEDWLPDVSFIPKRKFRRLSRLSKMALYAAHHASIEASNRQLGASVFCSNYGEFQHTTNVLKSVQDGDLVSPMDFSYSVHNTGQGLFSILNGSDMPATAIAAREGGVEHALCKAHAQLLMGDDAVLVVYHEDILSKWYEPLLHPQILPLSFALVVSRVRETSQRKLKISYKSSSGQKNKRPADNHHEQSLVRMLGAGQGTCQLDLNRLTWVWQCETS